MRNVWMLAIVVILGGCSSDTGKAESSALPWNRPADWEMRRDITTSTSISKEYYPENFQ